MISLRLVSNYHNADLYKYPVEVCKNKQWNFVLLIDRRLLMNANVEDDHSFDYHYKSHRNDNFQHFDRYNQSMLIVENVLQE